jgi:hypothetical protein
VSSLLLDGVLPARFESPNDILDVELANCDADENFSMGLEQRKGEPTKWN